METILYTSLGHHVYQSIPANTLRGMVDSAFPRLSTLPIADAAAGRHHRFKVGHDLLFDLPSTYSDFGFKTTAKHLGHIVLTDFPTRDGIPIPGLSSKGAGEYLVRELGISPKWLSVNVSESFFGYLTVTEGYGDLIHALSGDLKMSTSVFFDTFMEGSFEIWAAFWWKNPILLIGGVENILAGVAAVWNSCVISIDPVTFLSSVITSSVIGYSLSYYGSRAGLPQSIRNAFRGSVVGGLFAVAPALGFGALGGFFLYRAGSRLAEMQTEKDSYLLNVSIESFNRYRDAIFQEFSDLRHLLELELSVFPDHPAHVLIAGLPDQLKSSPARILNHDLNPFKVSAPQCLPVSLKHEL